jgi:hypothetical protein
VGFTFSFFSAFSRTDQSTRAGKFIIKSLFLEILRGFVPKIVYFSNFSLRYGLLHSLRASRLSSPPLRLLLTVPPGSFSPPLAGSISLRLPAPSHSTFRGPFSLCLPAPSLFWPLRWRAYLLYMPVRSISAPPLKRGYASILHSANIQTFFTKKRFGGFFQLFFFVGGGFGGLSDTLGPQKSYKYTKIITFAVSTFVFLDGLS